MPRFCGASLAQAGRIGLLMVGEIHGGSYVNGERVAGRQSLGEGQSLTRMTIV
jgi:hypothetical protein